MSKIITVIVPTYNMETLLRKGLDSLLIDEGLEDVEVLVINDGSRDASSAIAHEYERRSPSSFKVIDKENGNYGSCVNSGLVVAQGRYVKIMDSDDSFHTGSFERLVSVLRTLDVDIVFSDYVKEYTSGKTIEYEMDLPSGSVLQINDYLGTRSVTNIQMPAITYRTDLLRSMDYHQTEGISYTDTEWCFAPFTQVKTFYYLKTCIYRYLLGREGQTMDPEVFMHRISHRVTNFVALLQGLAGLDLSLPMRRFAEQQLVKHALPIYDFYLRIHHDLDREPLRVLDETFARLNPGAHSACGRIQFRLHLPYYYINDWRKTDRRSIPVIVKLLARFLDFCGSIRVKLFMKDNPNVEK